MSIIAKKLLKKKKSRKEKLALLIIKTCYKAISINQDRLVLVQRQKVWQMSNNRLERSKIDLHIYGTFE